MNLTEATILALQGKLKLDESKSTKKENLEIEINDKVEVKSDEATVTIEQPVVNTETEEIIETDPSLEVADTEEVEELSDTDIDSTIADTLEESKKIQEDDEEDDDEEEDDEEDDDEEEESTNNEEEEESDEFVLETFEDVPNAVTKIKEIISNVDAAEDENKQAKLDEIVSLLDSINTIINSYDEVEQPEVTETEETTIEENKIKYSSNSFNKVLENYYKEKYNKNTSFNVKKLSKNEKGDLKIEGVLKLENKSRNLILKLEKVKSYNNTIKYNLIEGFSKKLENKNIKSKKVLATINKDNILECKYINKK